MKGKKHVWNFVDYLKKSNYFKCVIDSVSKMQQICNCTKRGHRLHQTSSGKASMAGPINLETESNHIGWPEHTNS